MKKRLYFPLILLCILMFSTLACNFLGKDDDGGRNDRTAPEIVSSTPADGDTQVSRTPDMVVVFNTAMDRASVEAATGFRSDFFVEDFNTTWTDSLTYIVTPANILGFNTRFTLSIDTGAMNSEGEYLAQMWSISFITATREPVVAETYPEQSADEVPTNISPWLLFNQAMDQASVEEALSIAPAVDFVCSWPEPERVVLQFQEELAPETIHTIFVSTDAAGESGEYFLAVEYSFAFTTAVGGDSETPYIIAWDPPQGSQAVPRDAGMISILFSEAVNPATVFPELFDMRLLTCLGGFAPDWNADYTELSLAITTLPAGVELFIDLAPFEDAQGNSSDDPEPWVIRTAGEPDWFPAALGDTWLGLREGEGDRCPWEYAFTNKVENMDGGMFDIVEYSFERCEEAPLRAARFNKLSDRVELLSLGKYSWDDDANDFIWDDHELDPQVDFLGLPPESGDSWEGIGMIELSEDPGQGNLVWSATILGFEDLELTSSCDRGVNLATAGGDRCPPTGEDGLILSTLLPDCAILQLDHVVTVELLVGEDFETFTVHSGIDTLWICAGVGMVRMHSHAENSEPGGCTDDSWSKESIYWWSLGD